MLLHQADTTGKRLAGCYKRANNLAKEGPILPSNPLATSWANCKLFLEGEVAGPFPKRENKSWNHRRRLAEALVFNLVCLDWFALKVDEYAKTHILKGDPTVAAILYEWRSLCFVNAIQLTRGATP